MSKESAAAVVTRPHELPSYAEVAVPLYVFQTFTYQLSAEQSAIAEIGARILVPLGRNLVTGFIVNLHSELPNASELNPAGVKEAHSIVDSIPVCTPEILQLTRWVAEYYGSPWGEVIKASLPPGISPEIQELITITDAGTDQLNNTSTSQLKSRVLAQLFQFGPSDRSTLASFASPEQLSRSLRELDQAGFITRKQRPGSAEVKTKLRKFVRIANNAGDTAKTTAAQQRILDTLERYGPVSLQSLLKSASVTPQTVSLLAPQSNHRNLR